MFFLSYFNKSFNFEKKLCGYDQVKKFNSMNNGI